MFHAQAQKTYRTDALFSRTNFRIGGGSIFNLAGNYYKFHFLRAGTRADNIALENDWGLIGQDLKKAITKFAADNL